MKQATAAYKGMASAAREYREALRALEAAKGQSDFAGNMSRADFVLAQQARQAAIKAARERVSDAQKALRDHRETMHRIEHETGITAQRIGQKLGKDGPIIKGLQGTIEEARKSGKDIAQAIKDAIFGPEGKGFTIPLPGGIPGMPGVRIPGERSGGLVGAMQGLQGFLQTMSGHLANLNGLLGGNGPLVLGLLALVKLLPGVPGVPTPKIPIAPIMSHPLTVAMLTSAGFNAGLDRILPPRSARSRALEVGNGKVGMDEASGEPRFTVLEVIF
jgi:tetrahydromethanopterin S-methyltransferase subunit G